MATLVGNVNSSATSWTVSAAISSEIDYLSIDSETVQVLTHTPSQLDPQTRTPLPPKIKVQRAAGGTTAALHTSGAILTPVIPPAATAGPGGGGVTVTDETVTVADATTLSMPPFSVTDAGGGEATYSGDIFRDATAADQANIYVSATAVDGLAKIQLLAETTGDGQADVGQDANTAGTGQAFAGADAHASGDGEASVNGTAVSDGSGSASADSTAEATGSGDAQAIISATTATGEASASLACNRGATRSTLDLVISNAGVASAFLYGLPTVDPEVVDQLWNDAGTLKVSAG